MIGVGGALDNEVVDLGVTERSRRAKAHPGEVDTEDTEEWRGFMPHNTQSRTSSHGESSAS